MAHGSPDHTRLSDDAYSHFQDKWSYSPWGGLDAGDPANYIIDVSMVGLLGDIYVLCTDPGISLKVAIDGTTIFSWDVATLITLGLWGYSNNQMRMGCTSYNTVAKLYAMVFNANHQIYVHNTLQAWLVRSALGDNAAGYLWYKEKI